MKDEFKKEDFGFSKGGFEELEPVFEPYSKEESFSISEPIQEESDVPWYQQKLSADWITTDITLPEVPSPKEHKSHAMLDEHAAHDHFGTQVKPVQKPAPAKTAPKPAPVKPKEEGLIYLPKPEPILAIDRLQDKDAFMLEALKKQGIAAEDDKKSVNPFILVGVILMIVGFFFVTVAAEAGVIPIILGVFLLIIGIKVPMNKPYRDYYLISPYAIRKEKGIQFALQIYYQQLGVKKSAWTPAKYTEKQVDAIVAAFKRGQLIVAVKGDSAVILEPTL